MSEHAAKQVIVGANAMGVLRPDIELPFDDPELAGCTVGDVLADPERFEGETLADPLEGVDLRAVQGEDHAPGRRHAVDPLVRPRPHHLRAQTRRRQRAQGDGEAAKDEIVATFARLAAGADVDAVELEELRQLAKEISGVGLRVIDSALKAAQQARAEQRSREARQHRAAARQDPRPMIAAPFPDEPWLPQMDVLNEVIGKVATAVPPLRNIDGVIAQPSKRPVPDTRPFTDANPEGDD